LYGWLWRRFGGAPGEQAGEEHDEHPDRHAAQRPKDPVALDEHQVRTWTSWHRWTILALLAQAFLAVLSATQAHDQNPHDDQLIPLTCNEIRRLFTGLCQQPPVPRIQLHRICRCECVSKWLPGIVWKIILQCWLRSRGAAARI
jgi:hypothetical protein